MKVMTNKWVKFKSSKGKESSCLAYHPITLSRICPHRKPGRFFGTTACSFSSLMSKELRSEDVITLREDDIATIETIEKLMEPLKVATALLCEEENITPSIVAPFQANLRKYFHLAESELYIITKS